jgi:hypothetical protein
MLDLNAILARFERKLRELKGGDQLTAQAPTVFKEFADQVNRRTNGDRRRDARGERDRRKGDPRR